MPDEARNGGAQQPCQGDMGTEESLQPQQRKLLGQVVAQDVLSSTPTAAIAFA